MVLRMEPRIEFCEEFRIDMFNDREWLNKEVATLTRISRPIGGNPTLPVWEAIELGALTTGAFNLRTPVTGLIYSPRVLGRQLNITQWEDCVCAYNAFFNFFNDNAWNVEEMRERFAPHHAHFCKWNFDDLYQAWVAQQEKQHLLQHVPSAADTARKKI